MFGIFIEIIIDYNARWSILLLSHSLYIAKNGNTYIYEL
jgi:hypothetical protein